VISCTEFIPAYSELFKFLEKKGGKQAVLDFWHFLSDSYLSTLKDLVVKNGIRGCWMYWSQTLNEEAADFTMELDEASGEFSIIMHHCPSKGRLLELKHLEPYKDYCQHCDVLYRRVLEPLGYEYAIDRSASDKARCRVTVKARPEGQL
jgi:predicted ArsR family transcriptional regulator